MQTRKRTAWKKSRTFGDVKGGRRWPKRADRIFARTHSLRRPSVGDDRPVFITDNPSRDFFFPIGVEDVRRELARLPRAEWSGITHVWFRRFKKSEYEAGELPLAEFCCGSGVRLITLYPWPRSLEWNHGEKNPNATLRRVLARHGAELSVRGGEWISSWDEPGLRGFYVEHLLLHEVGHHVDWYSRNWSKANRRVLESAANQYAFSRTTRRATTWTPAQDSPSPAE